MTHAGPAVALQYYHTVRPIITSSEAILALFMALAQTSVSQAFFFSRTFPLNTREQLLHQLITNILDHDDDAHMVNGHGKDEPMPDAAAVERERARELALLPFDSIEETWFEYFLESGAGRKLRWAKDALVMRRIASGKFAEARATEGLGRRWALVLDGLR